MQYETVIGLEVHVQLNTESKMFCGCSTKFGAAPNSHVCPVCLGFPGVLPVINKKAMYLSVKTALALNCQISKFTKFDRKHYYYPDLPKNYQISQFDKPLSYDGFLDIGSGDTLKRITLKRIHLEEDAGKLVHQKTCSLVDYNRSGTPLLEIVTEPDLRSPDEAYEFLTRLKTILEYLEVSDCNMEEGSLRCDANISVRPKGATALGTKTEVKNMNSFKGVRQALAYESGRLSDMAAENKRIIQETRLWDADRQVTESMRSKEEAHDYRYFPEPDLLPFVPPAELIDELRRAIPEMPQARKKRFIESYQLSEYDASVMTQEKAKADYFEETVKGGFSEAKIAANWIMGDVASSVAAANLSFRTVSLRPAALVTLLKSVQSGAFSGKMAKEVIKETVEGGKDFEAAVNSKGTQLSDDSEIGKVIDKIVSLNPKAEADFRSGKETAIAFLVGQVMRETKGKANPKIVNDLLKKKLS